MGPRKPPAVTVSRQMGPGLGKAPLRQRQQPRPLRPRVYRRLEHERPHLWWTKCRFGGATYGLLQLPAHEKVALARAELRNYAPLGLGPRLWLNPL